MMMIIIIIIDHSRGGQMADRAGGRPECCGSARGEVELNIADGLALLGGFDGQDLALAF